jgi:hypothetical protein
MCCGETPLQTSVRACLEAWTLQATAGAVTVKTLETILARSTLPIVRQAEEASCTFFPRARERNRECRPVFICQDARQACRRTGDRLRAQIAQQFAASPHQPCARSWKRSRSSDARMTGSRP